MGLNSSDDNTIQPFDYQPIPKNKGGRPKGSTNLHSKHPSGIAVRLKRAGVDWVRSFAVAVRDNDRELLSLWVRMLPYLVVTQGHQRPKRFKGRASKAAMAALNELEGR